MASGMGGLVLVAFVAAAVLLGLADAATNTQPGVDNYLIIGNAAGGEERARCIGLGKCYQKLLTCPTQCKSRSNLEAGPKACFIDCLRCETTCKHRKPNCYGFGALCYDPRLIGGDGTMFYFHGEKDQDFCLVSDRNLHINAHFIGIRPEGRSRDYTWVQAIGLLFGSHKFSVGAKKVAHWDDDVDQLFFSFDGEPFIMEEEAGATWVSKDRQLTVERTYRQNVVDVTIKDMLSILIQVVPITPKEDKAHNYQIPSDDVFAHLDMQFKFYNLSSNVNGLLGQTYQPGYVSKAKIGVMMPILGGEDRFFTSGLLNSDCTSSQFLPQVTRTEEPVEILTPFRTDCSSKNAGNGIVCRR